MTPILTIPPSFPPPKSLHFTPKHTYGPQTISTKRVSTKDSKKSTTSATTTTNANANYKLETKTIPKDMRLKLSEYQLVALHTTTGVNNDLFYVQEIKYPTSLQSHVSDAATPLSGSHLRKVTLKGRYARRFTELFATRRETDECRVFLDKQQVEISLEDVIDVAPIALLRNANVFEEICRNNFRLVFYALELVDIGSVKGEQPSSEFFHLLQPKIAKLDELESKALKQKKKREKDEPSEISVVPDDESEYTFVKKQVPLPDELLQANAMYWKDNKEYLAKDLSKKALLDESRSPLVGMDLYSGCGGLTLGLDKKGVTTKWAVEYRDYSTNSFRTNFPGTQVFNMDCVRFYNVLFNVCKVHHFIHMDPENAVYIADSDADGSVEEDSTERPLNDDERTPIFEIVQIECRREAVVYAGLGDGTYSKKPMRKRALEENEKVTIEKTKEKRVDVNTYLAFCIREKEDGPQRWVRWHKLVQRYGPIEHLQTLLNASIHEESIFPKYYNLPAPGEVDVLYGGPPCQGFSNCNRFTEGGDDETKNLQYYLFCKFAKVLQPKYVLAENVVGVLSKKNRRIFQLILDTMSSYHYTVRLTLLNAVNFGVPQGRPRTILMATRDYVDGIAPMLAPEGNFSCQSHRNFIKQLNASLAVESFTSSTGYQRNWLTPRTTWSSLSDLPTFHDFDTADPIYNGYGQIKKKEVFDDEDDDPVSVDENGDEDEENAEDPPSDDEGIEQKNALKGYLGPPLCPFQREMRNNGDKLQMHVCKGFGARAKMFALAIPFGNKQYHVHMARYMQRALGSNYSQYRKNTLSRAHFDLPRRTIMTRPCVYSDGLVPDQHRVWSVRENARAQCFPDAFYFAGGRYKAYEQIGNAVPHLLAAALGESLTDAFVKWCRYEAQSEDYEEERLLIEECDSHGKVESRRIIEELIQHILDVKAGVKKCYIDDRIPPLRSNSDSDIPDSYRNNDIADFELKVRKKKGGRVVESEYSKLPSYLLAQDDCILEYPFLVRNKKKAERNRKELKRKADEALFEEKKRRRVDAGHLEAAQYTLNMRKSVTEKNPQIEELTFDLGKLKDIVE